MRTATRRPYNNRRTNDIRMPLANSPSSPTSCERQRRESRRHRRVAPSHTRRNRAAHGARARNMHQQHRTRARTAINRRRISGAALVAKSSEGEGNRSPPACRNARVFATRRTHSYSHIQHMKRKRPSMCQHGVPAAWRSHDCKPKPRSEPIPAITALLRVRFGDAETQGASLRTVWRAEPVEWGL